MKQILTLEHIAPYLPYGLHIIHPDIDGEQIQLIMDPAGSSRDTLSIDDVLKYDCKPILRPMSDLTRPIKIDGKEVVPLMEIGKMIEPEYKHLDTDNEGNYLIGKDMHISCGCPYDCNCGSNAQSYILFYDSERKNFYSTVYIDANPDNVVGEDTHESYEAIKWLYKHKFDIDGLIESGLAIDANTLETNPYE